MEKKEEMGGRENSRDNTGSGAEDKVFMSSHVVSFDPGRSQDTSPHHHHESWDSCVYLGIPPLIFLQILLYTTVNYIYVGG